jgi:hypothetical protein
MSLLLPQPYKQLIQNYTGSKKYVDSVNGSDSNNGNTYATAYATLTHCHTQLSGVSTPTMIILAPGTYDTTPGYFENSMTAALLADYGNERVYVAAPDGQVIIQYTASGTERDTAIVQFRNANSAIYGAILKRNNNARSTNYTVSFFRGHPGSTYMKGLGLFNCVIQETNANNAWSLQYDNNGDASFNLYNCTFYTGANGLPDYSGGAGFVLNDCAFNYTYGTGSASKTNTVVNQTINASTYELSTNNTSYGVWSGQYAWGQPIDAISFSVNGAEVESANEGQVVTVNFVGRGAANETINYTITGISSADISGASLTGSVTLVDNEGSITLTLANDLSSGEGVETMNVSFVTNGNTYSSNLIIYDTSAVLVVVSATQQITVGLNTSLDPQPNGTLVPYTISGDYITAQNIGIPLTGNFTVVNNSATLILNTGYIPTTTVSISAFGETVTYDIVFPETMTENIIDVPVTFDLGYYKTLPVQQLPNGISISDYEWVSNGAVDNYKTGLIIPEELFNNIPISMSDYEWISNGVINNYKFNTPITGNFSTIEPYRVTTVSSGGRMNVFTVNPLGAEIINETWY